MAEGFTLSLGGLQVHWDTPSDGSVRLDLEGELDNLSVPVLRQALDSVYADECFRVRLDLAGLEFIDSSGLGALVGAWRRCSQQEGSVTVLNPKPTVRQLMDMTGISKFLLAPEE
ncbi:STAS domain-containing protein [Acidiferrimicrobium sp. IK]|uniref:STAS domain-containing protein n=1 Tax=Acidiferrimicrobium sp. IK TaxID=2871700 RepID=UPI0021CB15DF|nr:STAS domain-containing protein [Acidiferrimicrobium sp. IK]MCU4183408.1 STAS domain-containing protein [Acidiferrimicrobium sp. IK]